MATKPINYRQLNQELDQVLSELESADLDIETALQKYQRGMEIIQQLETYLKIAENKVTKLKATWDKQIT